MFSEVRLTSVLHVAGNWGAICCAVATLPLIALRTFGALDGIAADYICIRHPHTASIVLIFVGQMIAFFPGAVMGFWVGLTREKVRARSCEQPGSDNSLRS
jgi:hypothetical protein